MLMLFLYAIVLMMGLFGVLLLVYVPHLDPYPGYTPMRNESLDDAAYEELPGGEHISPERHANLFSSMYLSVHTTYVIGSRET